MKNILPWMALKNVKGVGNHLYKKLIDHFHFPENIFQASIPELTQIKGVSRTIANAIKAKKNTDEYKQEVDLALKKGFQIITMADETFPPLLHHIPDPPPILYVSGCLEQTTENISIVGSRNATRYGVSMAMQLSKDLVHKNLTIISGMAKGIDTAAHRGALAGKGKTIAVLGSGLDIIYPKENRNLFHEISETGAVISEFPFGTAPAPHNFPIRNRIICGMSLGTIVVEAALKSGSLITARLAAEQGREVFAVPGSVRSFKSTGTHSLLKQGAKLVEQASDVMEEILPFVSNLEKTIPANQDQTKKIDPTLDSDETIVFKALEPYPVHIDNIVRSTGFSPGKLAGILLKLELEGIITQSPGKHFSSCEE